MTELREISFTSSGVRCSAWHLAASSDELRQPGGRPCVVMAHGFGGTKDTGLLAYAEGFAAVGLEVFVFDYRGFGASDGLPRQRVSHLQQRDDYHAAIRAARSLPGVDPNQVVLWGTSYSGGHVVPVAVADARVAAVVSLTPAMDGLAALGVIARRHPSALLPLVWHGLRDALLSRLGGRRRHVAIVGEPGALAMISSPGAMEGYRALAGPTWRNEVCAQAALEVAFNRPGRSAAKLRTPLLVQIGERDAVAPPAAAHRAAERAGRFAEVRTYPVDHFDVYTGSRQRQVLADQIDFVTRHLATPAPLHSVTPSERQVGR
ncbi:MAG: alpha/beta fold hydrolase [Nocardioides sp.]